MANFALTVCGRPSEIRNLIRIIVLAFALVLGIASSAQATFPGRNGEIAFQSLGGCVNSECAHQIDSVRPDGTGRRQLTFGPGSESGPAWSPDGERLAFSAEARNHKIVVRPRRGGSPVQVTRGGGPDAGPTWSPDGRRIAFMRAGRDTFWIVVIRANGTGQRAILRNAMQPDWSPDGRLIAFRRNGGIWVARPDGSRARRLTSPAGRPEDFEPSWSPDGRRIVFTRRPDGRNRTGIWIVNRNGHGERRILRPNIDFPSPVWSPDGRWIAYLQVPRWGVNDGIYVMTDRGTKVRRVTYSREDGKFDLAWRTTR